MLLAGDIGGTKTNLALYPAQGEPRAPLAEATFPSADYASLEALVEAFLSRVEGTVDRASFGVAGPVVDGRATITNLPWEMSEEQLRSALGFSSAMARVFSVRARGQSHETRTSIVVRPGRAMSPAVRPSSRERALGFGCLPLC